MLSDDKEENQVRRKDFRLGKSDSNCLIIAMVALLVVGFGMSSCLGPPFRNGEQNLTSKEYSAPSGGTLNREEYRQFAAIAKKLSTAVVNISTIRAKETGPMFRGTLGQEGAFREFWNRFFRVLFPYHGTFRHRSVGSGFIIEPDGFILTNNHVVENAGRILVKLSDEREFKAEVIGKDPKTDIALIKIDAKGSLPAVTLGDSERLEVGEWVLAMGNPFGLDHTVTVGIVSAKGRIIGAGPYDNFIQTDASINPGNSGGPLVDMQGEVVGVNTPIFTRSGGNIGIGFAIPINVVKGFLPQLKEKGKVVRGWLGVTVQAAAPAIGESLGMEEDRGALVSSVSKGGPADLAGIKVGDVIIEFDKKKIRQVNDLVLVVTGTPVGKEVEVKIIRDKKQVALTVEVGELEGGGVVATAKGEKYLGLTVQGVTPQVAGGLGLDRAEGVIVTAVKPGSPARDAGLNRGDVILEIDRKPILDLSDYREALADLKKGEAVLFLVRRGKGNIFLALKVPEGEAS